MVEYNRAKLEILEVLEITESTVKSVARVTKRTHACAGTLLKNYHKMGLINRHREGRGYVYSITKKGSNRLEWLESKRS